ncbi:DUF3000 family protein [Trueperella pyogenes]|uniref:DUF3000 family protein n=1 Tax=Trueperella pyogenes TaxID=1661 RepID=UPI002115040E|nr:DUF3000 family protein [Trueperella pyogenes]
MTIQQPPAEFITALDSLKGHEFRPELHVAQIPGPTRIAPWAVALQVEVNDSLCLTPTICAATPNSSFCTIRSGSPRGTGRSALSSMPKHQWMQKWAMIHF